MTIVRTTWQKVAGIVAVIAMMASLVTVPATTAAAQADGNTYTFASGQVLAWSGNWTLDPESVSQENGLEIVLLSQQLSFMAVLSVPAGLDLDYTRDTFLDGFLGVGENSITIDRGSYGTVSYSLDTINNEGIDMGVFTLLRAGQNGGETFAWVFISLIDTFAAQFAQAQSAFTLDGESPFTGVDGQGLQDQLVAAVASGNVPDDDTNETPVVAEGDETPEPDDVSTPEDDDTKTTGSGGLKGNNSTKTDDDATAEADDPTEEVDAPPSGEVGLIGDSTCVSPAYGVTLEWDANFTLDPTRDPNPSANTDGLEVVGLSSPTEGTPYFVTVYMSEALGTAQDYATVWASDEFLADTAISPNAEILLVEGNNTVAAVVMVDYLENGTPIITYNEFHVDAQTGTLVRYQYLTAASIVGSTLPLAQNGISVDGQAALTFFSTDEVVEAAAGA